MPAKKAVAVKETKETEEPTHTSIGDLPIDNTSEKSEGNEKKILIAKKLILARRVLSKVIDNLGYTYDILDDMSTLESKLASNEYDILFTDVKLITEGISSSNENIAIISSCDTKNHDETSVLNGKSIASTATKEEINNIIKKYRG
jgi:CheY-like chemotaxis protein